MEHYLTRLHVPMIKKTRRMSRSIINGKNQTHTPIASTTSCYVGFSVLHKETATVPSSILHANRKVQGVPQAQVASNTMMAGSKNTQAKDLSCKHKKCRVETCTSYTCMLWQPMEILSKSLNVVGGGVLSWRYFKQQTKFYSFKILSTDFFFHMRYASVFTCNCLYAWVRSIVYKILL